MKKSFKISKIRDKLPARQHTAVLLHFIITAYPLCRKWKTN